MSVIRIAFLGTPEFARYQLESIAKDPHFQIVGVVSQPDRPSGRHMRLTPSPVKAWAQAHGLKVMTPESASDPQFLQEIAEWNAEAAVVVAYGQILSQKFLDIFPLKVVNVHASLLPRWRGAAPIQRAIQAGDEVTGVALQVMVRRLDAGAVIGQYSLPIPDTMDSQQLHDALMPLGAKLLHVDFMDYLRGNLSPTAQNEQEVTYAKKIEKDEAFLDWKLSAREVFNQVRAFVMGPGSVCRWGEKKLKIIKAEPVSGKGKAGTLIEVRDDSFVVACREGALRVWEVQPESRPKMKVRDFLLGNKLAQGDVFE